MLGHRLWPPIKAIKSGILDRILPEKDLIPSLATSVGRLWSRPYTVVAVRADLVANVSATALPIHGVAVQISLADDLHRLDALILVEGGNVVSCGSDEVVLLGRALVVALGVTPIDRVGRVLFSGFLAEVFVELVRAVLAEVILATGGREARKIILGGTYG